MREPRRRHKEGERSSHLEFGIEIKIGEDAKKLSGGGPLGRGGEHFRLKRPKVQKLGLKGGRALAMGGCLLSTLRNY